ncbi:MAG: hypothetical protein H7841_05150 [Magnetospirillum sp. WYHS-4]
MVDETLSRLLGLIETFLQAVPSYETPEIQDNGDIVIRRKKPPTESPTPPKSGPMPPKKTPGPDTTRT